MQNKIFKAKTGLQQTNNTQEDKEEKVTTMALLIKCAGVEIF